MSVCKIASFENSHLPLIAKAASTGKPLIISIGMAALGELEEALNTAKEACCTDLVLLKCTSYVFRHTGQHQHPHNSPPT